jgi:4-amino-4-deoxy-L-arabinose transferase-like glycosyltransferase
MQPFVLSKKSRNLLWYSLLFMLATRLIASAFIPLADTTEARYAEIARIMLQTGDWITLQHDYAVPFWAKPPLSIWLSAASMQVLGINEFAVRLPALLLSIATLALVWHWVAQRRNRDAALAAVAVLSSMVLFFTASGAVMTDASLAFCTTVTMISFWQALHRPQKFWGYLFFAGLGVGLLAKGPVVGVLTVLPILPWIALRNRWRATRRALPWIRGSLLMAIIGLPWYWLAESKTPGFIAYFILGEHFGRFLQPGWTGDKYGNAHSEPLGTIWLYWFAAAFPWSLIVMVGALRRLRSWRRWLDDDSGLIAYLLLWSFTAMIFFSFSHNVIWTYPLPALPAFAVLTVELWCRFRTPGQGRIDASDEPVNHRVLAATFAMPIALLIMTIIYADDQQILLKASQRNTAEYYLQARPTPASGLYYFRRHYYSAEFYSAGKAQVIWLEDLEKLLSNGVVDFVVIQREELEKIPAAQRALFKSERDFGEFTMLEEVAPLAL